MKGPRPARMPGYGAGSKYLGRTEKETEWLRFHAQQAPGNSHCAPTCPIFSFCPVKSVIGDQKEEEKPAPKPKAKGDRKG